MKGYVDTILKRYDDCGLLYAISDFDDGWFFFVGDLALGVGAGAVANKGPEIRGFAGAKTGAIMVTGDQFVRWDIAPHVLPASLEAKYGKAEKNHMGVLEPDKNLKPKPGGAKTTKRTKGKNDNEFTYDPKQVGQLTRRERCGKISAAQQEVITLRELES